MALLTNEQIKLLNQKKETAFEVVFNLYYPRLVSFAKEYVSHENAKGLVQEAFISLWEKNPLILSEAQLQSYLYTIVKNNCLAWLRHEKVKMSFVVKTEQKFQNQIYLSALEQLDTSAMAFQEIEGIIEKTLAGLPPRCRDIFNLSRFQGKKNQEIADDLNISVKAVEAQITRAIKVFKVTLSDYLPLITFIFMGNQ